MIAAARAAAFGASATNHVKVALAVPLAGKPVSQAQTRPCAFSVKHSNL